MSYIIQDIVPLKQFSAPVITERYGGFLFGSS